VARLLLAINSPCLGCSFFLRDRGSRTSGNRPQLLERALLALFDLDDRQYTEAEAAVRINAYIAENSAASKLSAAPAAAAVVIAASAGSGGGASAGRGPAIAVDDDEDGDDEQEHAYFEEEGGAATSAAAAAGDDEDDDAASDCDVDANLDPDLDVCAAESEVEASWEEYVKITTRHHRGGTRQGDQMDATAASHLRDVIANIELAIQDCTDEDRIIRAGKWREALSAVRRIGLGRTVAVTEEDRASVIELIDAARASM
jgi:hypothetical protein